MSIVLRRTAQHAKLSPALSYWRLGQAVSLSEDMPSPTLKEAPSPLSVSMRVSLKPHQGLYKGGVVGREQSLPPFMHHDCRFQFLNSLLGYREKVNTSSLQTHRIPSVKLSSIFQLGLHRAAGQSQDVLDLSYIYLSFVN